MFENIGEKIKGFAKGVHTIGVIISLLAAIIILAVGIEAGISEVLTIVAVVVAVLGIAISWVMTCCLYGYGELIEKTSAIERMIGATLGAQVSPAEAERLKKLAILRQQGTITEEEYQQAVMNGRD